MNILVVGGAGYIGSHTARLLSQADHQVVLLDNLITGHGEIPRRLNLPFVQGDLSNRALVEETLQKYQIDAVFHFAAFCLVGESVHHPEKYYRNNVCHTLELLESMRACGVDKFIFSSTCATYGVPQSPQLDETHSQWPINPYGWTKFMVERILADYESAYAMRSVILRYFNAAGNTPDGVIGEDHRPESHLIPLCFHAQLGWRDKLTVFGTDYDTPDGTCVRDYIHVDDLAQAHMLGLDYLTKGGKSIDLNVGTERGYSVREVIEAVAEVTGKPVPFVEGERRAGDPAFLVAKADRIREVLGWKPAYQELRPIVETAATWFEKGGRYND